MALAFYFHPPNKMSAQQYDECISRLKAAGAMHPKGRLHHSCFGTPDNLMVYDIWASQADFEAFGATLGPIMQAIGLAAEPQVMALHNRIEPPAPRAKAAATKKPAKKKAASKKAKPKKKAKKR